MFAIGSIVLLALGALLYLAVGLHAVGLALMIVGALAAVLSLLHLMFLTRRGRRPPAQPM